MGPWTDLSLKIIIVDVSEYNDPIFSNIDITFSNHGLFH